MIKSDSKRPVMLTSIVFTETVDCNSNFMSSYRVFTFKNTMRFIDICIYLYVASFYCRLMAASGKTFVNGTLRCTNMKE